MARYQRKAQSVEAEQWRPNDEEQAKRFGIFQHPAEEVPCVPTKTGCAALYRKYWIVTLADGSFDTISDADFQATYETET